MTFTDEEIAYMRSQPLARRGEGPLLAIGHPPVSGHFDLIHDVVLADSDVRWRRVELSTEQIERLNNLTPAAGERHDETNMAVIDR